MIVEAKVSGTESTINKIGLLLSKADISMSKAEAIESCKIYFIIDSIKNIDNLLILTLKSKHPQKKEKAKKTNEPEFLKNWLNRLALTKEAYPIIGKIPKKETDSKISLSKDFSENPLLKEKINRNPTFKISIRNTGISEGKEKEDILNIKSLAKKLGDFKFKKTDMHSPNVEFIILNSRQKTIGVKLWENKDEFEKRKAHLRPILHPTAINPKLARAMINIAGAEKEILDPFCGMGGILLEASLIGLNAKGTDISPEMIIRAKINLQNEKSKDKITLYTMNGLNWKEHTECIVTDLPYGKSSKISTPLSELLDKTLKHYAPIAKKMALCFPQETKYTLPKELRKIYDFNIYIHKSLTRKIVILETRQPRKK